MEQRARRDATQPGGQGTAGAVASGDRGNVRAVTVVVVRRNLQVSVEITDEVLKRQNLSGIVARRLVLRATLSTPKSRRAASMNTVARASSSTRNTPLSWAMARAWAA
jgi:hypothetical protein